MTSTERRSVASLGLLYAFRMLGLFMVLPVLSVFLQDFPDATPQLLGFALGAYGLTQAMLQLPLGWLSDRIGRKPVIVLGLAMFALGSVVAANAETVGGIIVGRALQGAGAIASTLMALLADLTRDEQRSKAMAAIGMSIGLTFALAMVLGPWLSGLYGVSALFWLTAAAALVGVAILLLAVPTPVSSKDVEVSPARHLFGKVLGDRQLLRLDFGIFSLHCVLTALFVVLPQLLEQTLQLPVGSHGQIYVPLLLFSFLAMLPLMIAAERHGRLRQVFILAIAAMLLAVVLVAWRGQHVYWLWGGLLLFFTGFNLLEALLPSLVSRQVFAGGRGTAMGVYSTAQFLGIFAGGSLGGIMLGWVGSIGVFGFCAGLLAVWLLLALGMQAPQRARTIVLKYDAARYSASELVRDLRAIAGVADVMVPQGAGVAYVKVHPAQFEPASLEPFQR